MPPLPSISPTLSQTDNSKASFDIAPNTTFGSTATGLIGGSTGFSGTTVALIVGGLAAAAFGVWFFFFRK